MIHARLLRTKPRRWVTTLAAVLVLMVASALPASAHGTLDRSEPPNGGKVAEGRSTISLWFSEPIRSQASLFDLHTVDGVRAVITVFAHEADGGAFVEINTDDLLKATYILDWTVLSLDDGHPSRGSVIFGVGDWPVVVESGSNRPPAPAALAVRWMDLMAIMLAIGALTVSGRILDSAGKYGQGVRRRVLRIGRFGALTAVVIGVITPFMRVPRSDNSLGTWTDTTWSTLMGTSWGRWWTAREVGLILLAVILGFLAAGSRGTGIRRTAWATVVGVAGIEAWLGHASTLPRQSWLVAGASAGHLVAAGIWAGGLAILVVCLGPTMWRRPESRGPLLSTVWQSFSPVAVFATVALFATGLYESGRHLPDLGSAASTVYGTAIGAKILLMGLGLALAGANTLLINPLLAGRVARRLHRPAGWAPISLRGFNTVVVIEALVLAVAVVFAGLATSVATTRDVAAAAAETAPMSANVDGLFVTFEALPAGAGQSRLIVRTRATTKPEPGPITAVDVSLESSSTPVTTLLLTTIEAGRFETETARLTPGLSNVSVIIHRDGTPDAVARIAWETPVPVPASAGPLELATTGIAALLVLATSAFVQMKRRPRLTPTETKQLVYGRQT